MAEIIETTKIWTCKIGEVAPGVLPPGADGPMRDAVEQAYRLITGRDADFTFSGWGGSLTEPERAVVENRLPMADEIDALVAGLRARHVRRSDDAWPVPYCERCDGDWPCDATRAADALDALRTRLAQVEGERDEERRKFAWAESEIARLWHDGLGHTQTCRHIQTVVSCAIATIKGSEQDCTTLKAERDAAQARATQVEAERDEARRERQIVMDDWNAIELAKDAAEAHVARLVGALEDACAMAHAALAFAPEEYQRARDVRLQTVRAALTAPDRAALVARERAREAVVEAAPRVLSWLDEIVHLDRVPRACGACGTPNASCDMDCANAAYMSRDTCALRTALAALAAPEKENR